MIEIIFGNVLRAAVISSIGICVLLILKKTLFKEYTKSFNYYIWLIVIFRMMFPFTIPIYANTDFMASRYLGMDTSINNVESTVDYSDDFELINNPLANNNKVIDSSNNFTDNLNMLEILGYVWVTVVLIIILYRIFTYIKLKNTLIDLSCDVDNARINEIYNNLLTEMKISKKILLRFSEYTSIPLGIGFFRPYIVLSNIKYEEKDIIWILKHELMHYKRNDILYKFLVMAATSVYWFNPLIYLMNKCINIECELACDEKILHSCDFKERQNYALTLINSLKQTERNFLQTNLATKLGNKEVLKRRFESMFNKKSKKGILIGALAIIIATCSFGVISNTNGLNILGNKEAQASTTEVIDENVQLYKFENEKYKGYYLEIKDPTRVKVGYSSKLNTEGETVSQIAENNNAIAAINGGGFVKFSSDELQGDETNGGNPIGTVMTGGKVIYTDLSEDEKTDILAITKEGKLIVGKYSLNDLSELGAEEVLSFGPSLIVNGKMTGMEGDGGWGIAPRTAIGQKKDGTIIMLVIDGRNVESLGATMKEVQDVMFKLGAVNAINLDGGKSTSMYYGGNIINKLADNKGERTISTAIIVKSDESSKVNNKEKSADGNSQLQVKSDDSVDVKPLPNPTPDLVQTKELPVLDIEAEVVAKSLN